MSRMVRVCAHIPAPVADVLCAVPDAMLEDIVFTLEQFIRVLSECSERQLRAIGHVLPNQTLETAQYFMVRRTPVASRPPADTRF